MCADIYPFAAKFITSSRTIRRLFAQNRLNEVDPEYEWSSLMYLIAQMDQNHHRGTFILMIKGLQQAGLLESALNYVEPYGGESPLSIALAEGKLYVAKCLISLGAPVNNQNYAGLSPLHEIALLSDQVSTPAERQEVQEKLLQAGANPDLLDQRGYRADEVRTVYLTGLNLVQN